MLVLVVFTTALRAENVLFIGNSYTYGAGSAVLTNGGVPKLFEAIAAAKGKSISTTMLTAGGKDFAFHLKREATLATLSSQRWDWVVIQNLSTQPTHIGNLDQHLNDAEAFYKVIREKAPAAHIMIYETWARADGNAFYSGSSSKTSFVNRAEMNLELRKNYAETEQRLEALEPGDQVAMARVGAAFEKCLSKYPELNLSSGDLHHASADGSYLAALVIYSSVFNDSPSGAIRQFSGVQIDENHARKLQEVATGLWKSERSFKKKKLWQRTKP